MSMSLKSVDTADFETIGANDLESPDVVRPPQPQPIPEDAEKRVQRVPGDVSSSVKTESLETVLEALANVRSVVQREIDSLAELMSNGSHDKGEAEVPKIPPSPHKFPGVPGPTNSSEKEEAPSHASDDVTDQIHDSSEDESDDGDSDVIREIASAEAVYDTADGVYRCASAACGWEVVFGYCHGCQTEYAMEDHEDESDGDDEVVDPTDPQTVLRKGLLVSRNDSPPPGAIPDYLRPIDELVSRGATLIFCNVWSATLREDRVIVVQADDDLKEIYGSFIGEEDSWSIWIGRRIKLGEGDIDGRHFMEDLLDLIFTEDDDGSWITYKEGEDPAHWVTRPKGGPKVAETAEVIRVADEYDVWSGEDDEEPPVEGHADETSESEAESASGSAISDRESTWRSDDSGNSEV